jgi:hypothetical protein
VSQPRRPIRRINPGDRAVPTWFKIWFALVAVLGLGLLGLIVWAVVRIVERNT